MKKVNGMTTKEAMRGNNKMKSECFKRKHIYLVEGNNCVQMFFITRQRPYRVYDYNTGCYKTVVNDMSGNKYLFIDSYTKKRMEAELKEEKEEFGKIITEIEEV